MLISMTLTLMQGRQKQKNQHWMISATNQEISIKLGTRVDHFLRDLDFANVYIAWSSCSVCSVRLVPEPRAAMATHHLCGATDCAAVLRDQCCKYLALFPSYHVWCYRLRSSSQGSMLWVFGTVFFISCLVLQIAQQFSWINAVSIWYFVYFFLHKNFKLLSLEKASCNRSHAARSDNWFLIL